MAAQQPPVGHARPHVGRRQPKRAHHVDGGRQQLRVRRHIGFAEDVDVQLKMFAKAPTLLPLIAKQLRNREPANRFAQRVRAGPDHPRERGRHLRTQRDLAAALVDERLEAVGQVPGQRLEQTGELVVTKTDTEDNPLEGAVYVFRNRSARPSYGASNSASPQPGGSIAVRASDIVLRGVAQKHGLIACFMAKPFTDRAGSGLHVHVSLNDGDGRNRFASDDPAGTEELRQAIGGMKDTMAESMMARMPE